MKTLIPSATIYKVKLPSADDLRVFLEDHPLKPVGNHSDQSHGFVDVDTGEITDLVVEFQGGYAFSIKSEFRRIPTSTLKAAVKRKTERVEEELGYRPGRAQTRSLKEDAIFELLPEMPVQDSTTTCYYDTQRGLLYVPTTSAARSGVITSAIIKAVGAAEFTTVVVDGRVHGLTERLRTYLQDDDDHSFDRFDPSDHVVLKRESATLKIKSPTFDSSSEGLLEAIDNGFSVEEIGLSDSNVSLTLTRDFNLKSIKHQADTVPDDSDLWESKVTFEVLNLRDVVDHLLEMISAPGGTSGDPADGL